MENDGSSAPIKFLLLTPAQLLHTIATNIVKNLDKDEYASKRFLESCAEVV
jgi:hypothetical protein